MTLFANFTIFFFMIGLFRMPPIQLALFGAKIDPLGPCGIVLGTFWDLNEDGIDWDKKCSPQKQK